ncbi:MAG: ATP-dependent zinc metalloprotease FtsH [Candidatus Dadabacteria bacterium]|nr:ATP-dependent zinc metalloprotease FtsH [Candidatus Dadabacteria bacterium]MCY4042609.1 ATP-dependent zinc metalloprotease FtsH [Candidatus Dadabacteria bacterium]MCY4046764.1 ATP-dependent zinc metalloprotease FtsH [Candidatus Dadabacteria bacterium]
MKSSVFRSIFIWLLIFVGLVAFYQFKDSAGEKPLQISYGNFLSYLEDGKIKEVKISLESGLVEGSFADGFLPPAPPVDKADDTPQATGAEGFKTFGPVSDDYLLKALVNSKTRFSYEKSSGKTLGQILISWGPFLFLIMLIFLFLRQMQTGGSRMMSFGKNKARMLTMDKNRITFGDVAGIEEAKEEVREIVEFLRNPSKFTSIGGRIPKGVLLVGPPGTGKTLLARAIAGEANVPFFLISGSDFVEMFVGVGASRVRDLFAQAKKNSPCIVFVDEIDAVGRHRGAGLGGGHDEREQTLNQLLVEMDGFENNRGTIVMAATNRPDVLDPALLRPGRFDRQIAVPLPDLKGREAILKVHSGKTPLKEDVDLAVIARSTPGFSGADLENLVNESALRAARRGVNVVSMEDFEYAKDKVMMGSERKSLVISDKEREITAYHEAGHAIVAKLTPGTDPIHKVTIIPRGMALGLTQQIPEEDKYTQSRSYLNAMIMVLLGGRAAEEVIFGERTSGAGNDLKRVTEIARKMVCEWGMSENIGPISLAKTDEQVFLGKEFQRSAEHSQQTAEEIDKEIKNIVETNYKKTLKVVRENTDLLKSVARRLLKKESIDGKEIDEIMEAADLFAKHFKVAGAGT